MSQQPTSPAPEEPTTTEPETDATTDTGEDDEQLGDGGKRALRQERRARTQMEKERDALRAELDKMREASQSEQEKALAKARREGASEAEATWKGKWRSERIRGEALRVMNGLVTDPRLAFPHLDLGDDVMDDDGNVNSKALREAVDSLLEEYPALAADSTLVTHHGDIGPKRTTRPAMDMNSLLRQAAGRQ